MPAKYKVEYTKSGNPKVPKYVIKPKKPLKPQKYYNGAKVICELLNYSAPDTLQDIIDEAKKYTSNFKEIYLSVVDSVDDFGAYIYGYEFNYDGKFENENYEKELEKYKKDLEKYKNQMKKYEEYYTKYLIQKQAFDEWQSKERQKEIDKQLKKLEKEKIGKR